MRSSPKARKKTAFVPRVIFQAAAVAGVVPLCAAGLADCGGVAIATGDAGPDVLQVGVAVQCFDACATGTSTSTGTSIFSVAEIGFDVSVADVATIGFDGGDAFPGVADVGFGGGDVNVPDTNATGDAGIHDSSTDHVIFSVASHAFDAG
jgi:hypothetical protein